MSAGRISAVLVPLDGSELSARALPVAANLARRVGADIHLLSAVPDADEVAEREAHLAAVEVPGVRVHRTVVVDRDPAGEIHEALRRIGDAVACMASHGRGRSAALVGSVATEVVARGRDPLVLVGPGGGERPGSHGVIACVDEAPASAALVPVAIAWADRLEEPPIALTVAEPVPEAVRGPTRRRFGPDGDVEAYLDTLVLPFRDEGRKLETVVVYDPITPSDGLCTYVRDHPAALLVVGSRARTGLARIVWGSTAAAIVHGSSSPVLVIPRNDQS